MRHHYASLTSKWGIMRVESRTVAHLGRESNVYEAQQTTHDVTLSMAQHSLGFSADKYDATITGNAHLCFSAQPQ